MNIFSFFNYFFFRHTLLKYLDRLEAYSEIVASYQHYDPDFYFSTASYVKFRDQPLLKAAIEFAHEGKTRAVATLLERFKMCSIDSKFSFSNWFLGCAKPKAT